jgi:hypothetical protein
MSPGRARSLAVASILVLTTGAFVGRRLSATRPASGSTPIGSGGAADRASRATEPLLPGTNAPPLLGLPRGALPAVGTRAVSASSGSPGSEATLMARLRRIEDGDPAAALQLAREGNGLDPNGPDSAERAMIVVKSLAREGDLEAARGEAERMVNEYPGTPWAIEVERRTGAHPRVRR